MKKDLKEDLINYGNLLAWLICFIDIASIWIQWMDGKLPWQSLIALGMGILSLGWLFGFVVLKRRR
jgi:hypothetical protein